MNNIGLIIWGCKGGHRVFCSNGIVDYRQKTISDTIKDIRSFVRFNLINLTTYAIEFTDDYKVFTIYRSCNDNGTGAYVAITIYVPHVQKVSNLRSLLDTMMDSYFKEFVHPVFGTYYDGKYDDIELFSNYINTLEVDNEDKLYKYASSVQDDRPHLKLFEDINEVDSYFASPYRKEFFKCQEVMFMSMDLYNRRPETLRFNDEEKIIDSVSSPEKLPQLYVGDSSVVKGLKINGNNVDVSKYHTINASTTNISITLSWKYCEDSYIIGNVATLIEEGKLREKDGVIILGSNLPKHNYKSYPVKFTVNGRQVPEQLLYIKEAYSGDSYTPIKNSKFEINGDKLNNDFIIGLKPYPDKSSVQLYEVHTFKPSKNIDSYSCVDIEIETFVFRINFDTKISDVFIYVYFGNVSVKIAVPKKTGEEICLYLPSGTDVSSPKFDTEKGETEWRWDEDNEVLYLSPKVLEYELNIPEIVKSAVQSWDFTISGKSKKKGSLLFPGGNSYKIKLNSDDNVKNGKLVINDSPYKYQVTEGQNPSITPLLLYVQLTKKQEESVFEYTPCGTEYRTIRVTEDRIFPYKEFSEADILFDKKEYTKKVSREKKPIIIIQLEKNNIASVSSSQASMNVAQKEKDTKDVGRDDINAFILTFNNCAEYHTYGPSGDKKTLFDVTRLKMTSQSIDLYDKNEKKVLTIYKDERIFTDQLRKEYENQGFSLEYTEEGCLIKYRKHKEVTRKWIKLLSKRFFAILLFSLICIIGGWMYFEDNNIIAYGKFIPTTTEYSEKIERIEQGSINYLKIDKTVINNETVFLLKLLEVREDVYSNDEDSVFVYFEGVKDPIVVKLFGSNATQPDIKGVISKYIRGSKKADTVNIVVPSPIEMILNELTRKIINMPTQVDLDSLFEICNNYANKVNYSNLAVNKILQKAALYIKTKEDYEEYIKIFKRFDSYDEYKLVTESLEKLNEILKKAEEDANKQLAWKNNAINKKLMLWSLDCSPATVKNVREWYNAIESNEEKRIVDGVYNFKIAFQIYSSFFEAKRLDEVKLLLNYKSYFSTQQYTVIKSFCIDNNHFRELQGNPSNKLEFSKSYRIIQTW